MKAVESFSGVFAALDAIPRLRLGIRWESNARDCPDSESLRRQGAFSDLHERDHTTSGRQAESVSCWCAQWTSMWPMSSASASNELPPSCSVQNAAISDGSCPDAPHRRSDRARLGLKPTAERDNPNTPSVLL
jgi:hypothetical protein